MSDLDYQEAVLAGRNAVREIVERDPGRVERIYLQNDTGTLKQIAGMSRAAGLQVQFVPQKRLNALAPGINHQGAVALVSAVTYADADALFSTIAPTLDDVKERTPLLLALDGLEDPFNVGAILRSAAAAGVLGVLVSSKGAAPIGATALKASAGTALQLPIARVDKMATMLEVGQGTRLLDRRRRRHEPDRPHRVGLGARDDPGRRQREKRPERIGRQSLRRPGLDPDARSRRKPQRERRSGRAAVRSRPAADGLRCEDLDEAVDPGSEDVGQTTASAIRNFECENITSFKSAEELICGS